MSTSTQRLEIILAEDVQQARQREREAFDNAAGKFSQSVVLYGAGGLGRKVLQGLRACGVEPVAFCDANPALSSTRIEGISVLSPLDAIARFGSNSVFVVCVWHPQRLSGVEGIMAALVEMGAKAVCPFPLLFWKYADVFLPHYFWDLPSKYLCNRTDLQSVYAMLRDEESRRQFVVDLELRLSVKFLKGPLVDHGRQYFPKSVFQIRPDECFVDCGAYDGDTIKDLMAESGGAFRKIIAFEADPVNFDRLKEFVAATPQLARRTQLRQEAVAGSAGTLRFAATAAANASVSGAGETTVTCVALDDVLASESPTMIKMDIEGSELEALRGAKATITRDQPLLAICAYHRPSDLYEVPRALTQLEPESSLYLRSYALDGFDTVCFAVPPSRGAAL